ncbi:MAG: hypothetical protein CSA65_06605 [Proteobacteria bacterium]|nr:MAG: hypothetical protein CSA65_06605 [Pseudomonadota bacterium]
MIRASRPSRTITVAFGALVALTFASVAGAQPKVAVLGVQSAGGAPPELAQRCSAALGTHLKEAGYTRVQGKSLVEIKLVFGCINESATCMAKVGTRLKADKLLWGTLLKDKGGYVLKLALLDVATGKLAKGRRRFDEASLAKDPEASLRKVVGLLLPRQIGTIKLTSTVSGAEVLLDGRAMGPINDQGLDMQVSAGSHTLQVRRDGYRAWVKRVTLGAGETLPLTASLELIDKGAGGSGGGDTKLPSPVLKKGKKSRTGWKVAFYIATAAVVGVGVGLIVNGTRVNNLVKDKEAELLDLNSQDAKQGCGLVNNQTLTDICAKGESAATLQNVLIGGIAAAALVAAFFFYKAYLGSDDEDSTSDDTDVAAADVDRFGDKIKLPERITKLKWNVSPSVGPQGAHLGFNLNF